MRGQAGFFDIDERQGSSRAMDQERGRPPRERSARGTASPDPTGKPISIASVR
jgi:hypothetical protein